MADFMGVLKYRGITLMRMSFKWSIVAIALSTFISIASLPWPAWSADYKDGVSATVLKKSSVTGNGQKIVYPVTDKAEITAMRVELAEGAETGWHSHPVPVYAYVLNGELDIELDGGKVVSYRAGDAIVEVLNTLHNGRNRGPGPVRLAVFYTGIEGTPNVIKPAKPKAE